MMVLAHEFLFAQLPDEISKDIGLVVIDESFWQSGLREMSISAETFVGPPGEQAVLTKDMFGNIETHDTYTNDLHAIRAKVVTAFQASGDGYLRREHLLSAGLSEEDCAFARRLEWQRRREVSMRPGMSHQERLQKARIAAANGQLLAFHAFWTAAREMLASDVDETGRIELIMETKRDGNQRIVIVNIRRAMSKAVLACPILLLDGTADLSIVRYFVPAVELIADERPRSPYMTVRQIIGGLSKTSLEKRPDRVAEIRDFVLLKSGGEPTLVVTHKGLEDAFAGMGHVKVAHFGAIAGRDEWKDVRHLFVIGGPQPAPQAARESAVQLTGRAIPLANPAKEHRGVLMIDGSGVEIEVSRFDDPDVEVVRAAIMDAAIVQAVGRGRGVNRDAETPLDVWIKGNVITPWPVTDILRWNEVALSDVQRMEARGRILLSPVDAHTCYPDLFKTVKAAEHALRRADFPPKSLFNSTYKGLGGKSMVEVSYRPISRGQQNGSVAISRSR